MEEIMRFIPKDTSYLEAHFLTDAEQKAYEDAVKHFKSETAQGSLNVPKNGSNLWKILLLNQIGIRTATLAELDQIAQASDDFLRGTYEDSASVALRSNGDSYQKNDYLAKSLARLIRKRTFKEPVVVNGLGIKEDSHSPYGLGFKQETDFAFFEAPELRHENNLKRFNVLDERGMPIFDENGTRTSYTRSDGLSRLLLGRDLGLGSDWRLVRFARGWQGGCCKTGEAGSQKIKGDYSL